MRIINLVLINIFMISIIGTCYAEAEFKIMAAIDQPKGLPGAIAFESFKSFGYIERRPQYSL